MENTVTNVNETSGIDLKRALMLLWQKSLLIIVVSIVFAVAVFGATRFLITPKYESSVMFYVNNSNLSVGDSTLSISTGDISASKSLVESYIVILNTRQSLNEVIEHAEVDITYTELKKMITASAVNDTEIFEVVVTSDDPAEAELLANAIAAVLPQRISGIIENTSARVVDAAVIATKPSSPGYTINTVIGFIIGFIVCVAAILLRDMINTTIQAEEDVTQVCAYPILTAVPDMYASGKGGYYYGYGEDGKKKKSQQAPDAKPLIGSEISFAASESYKLLRTMLEYSFADEKNCRVIGITSALSGEGKSLTAVNLALNLAQMRNKVLLIDCDMRRPSIAAKLNMEKAPGLSGYLSGQKEINSLIRLCGIRGAEKAFHVITSGTNPPNPVELLGSARMEKMLKALREPYDYIILDLPPVCEVSDALVVAKQTDGILMVVREDHCSRSLLTEALGKLEFVDARILGVAYNCANKDGGHYGKGYYKRYYKYSDFNGETENEALVRMRKFLDKSLKKIQNRRKEK